MNVADLAEKLASEHELPKNRAKQLVEHVFAAMAEAAANGEEVSIPGFGKFRVNSREARQGRNPATGATIQIAASKKLAFAPAKQIKDRLNVGGGKAAPKAAGKAPARGKKAS